MNIEYFTKYPPSLQHGFAENKSVAELLSEFYKIEIKNYDLAKLLDKLENVYQKSKKQIQPTYGQFSIIRLKNKFNYLKNQILLLDCWTEDEILQNKNRITF